MATRASHPLHRDPKNPVKLGTETKKSGRGGYILTHWHTQTHTHTHTHKIQAIVNMKLKKREKQNKQTKTKPTERTTMTTEIIASGKRRGAPLAHKVTISWLQWNGLKSNKQYQLSLSFSSSSSSSSLSLSPSLSVLSFFPRFSVRLTHSTCRRQFLILLHLSSPSSSTRCSQGISKYNYININGCNSILAPPSPPALALHSRSLSAHYCPEPSMGTRFHSRLHRFSVRFFPFFLFFGWFISFSAAKPPSCRAHRLLLVSFLLRSDPTGSS